MQRIAFTRGGSELRVTSIPRATNSSLGGTALHAYTSLLSSPTKPQTCLYLTGHGKNLSRTRGMSRLPPSRLPWVSSTSSVNILSSEADGAPNPDVA
eukprot:scaffold1900_cov389-Prasinococcus_capsulatus_cf.AAC.33